MCRDGQGHTDQPLTEVVIPSDLYAAKDPEQAILDLARQCGYDQDDQFAIQLALEEALTNAIRHGNRNDATKHITVRYSVSPSRVVIRVADEGEGFSPTKIPDPTTDDRLDCPSGRGVMLMHAYMTKVSYNDRGNEVTLIKTR